MKWGIRRTPEQLGHKTPSKTKWRIKRTTKEERYQKKKAKLDKKSEELSRKEELQKQKDDLKRRKEALKKSKESDESPKKQTTELPKNKNVKDMSDEELRQVLNRYNMEQQYKKITQEQTSGGKSWVKGMLVKAGQEVAAEYTKKAMKAGVEALLKMGKSNTNTDSTRRDDTPPREDRNPGGRSGGNNDEEGRRRSGH